MTDTLTPTQTLLLWGLLARQGIAAQKDIMPAPKAADRKALEIAKLISVHKVARALVLQLEDRGWAWAAEHLRDPLPPAQGTLQAMMGLLHAHLAAENEALGDFIGTPPPLSFRGGAAEPGTREPTVPAQKPTLKSIKDAYLKASGKQKAVRLPLADLRRNLPKIERTALDAALCRAHLQGKLILLRHDNPAEITAEVSAAQIDFKGVAMHLIWIEK